MKLFRAPQMNTYTLYTYIMYALGGELSTNKIICPWGTILHHRGVEFSTISGGEFTPQDN